MTRVKSVNAHNIAGGVASSPTRLVEPPPSAIQVDDARALTSYANFCRVTGTPEELILDFGLNSQPPSVLTGPVTVTQRIVCNLYTAKRLVQVLQMSIDRHEATFGVLETNVERRVRRP